jgi:hypothetical protein
MSCAFTVLLQQPRHQSYSRSLRFDEDILRFVLLPKVNPFKSKILFPILLCTMKLSQLVFFSPPTVRALHGKLSRQTSCALYRNFERALRTTHAAHVSVGGYSFLKDCHGHLLSYLRFRHLHATSPFQWEWPGCNRTGGSLSRRNDNNG